MCASYFRFFSPNCGLLMGPLLGLLPTSFFKQFELILYLPSYIPKCSIAFGFMLWGHLWTSKLWHLLRFFTKDFVFSNIELKYLPSKFLLHRCMWEGQYNWNFDLLHTYYFSINIYLVFKGSKKKIENSLRCLHLILNILWLKLTFFWLEILRQKKIKNYNSN